MMKWKTVKEDGNPPYDTKVIVRGANDKGIWSYAIAYNDSYEELQMMQIICTKPNEQPQNDMRVPFPVEEWAELEFYRGEWASSEK